MTQMISNYTPSDTSDTIKKNNILIITHNNCVLCHQLNVYSKIDMLATNNLGMPLSRHAQISLILMNKH